MLGEIVEQCCRDWVISWTNAEIGIELIQAAIERKVRRRGCTEKWKKWNNQFQDSNEGMCSFTGMKRSRFAIIRRNVSPNAWLRVFLRFKPIPMFKRANHVVLSFRSTSKFLSQELTSGKQGRNAHSSLFALQQISLSGFLQRIV